MSFQKKKIRIYFIFCLFVAIFLSGRLFYVMIARANHYEERVTDLHEREREIKAPRGTIYDRNGIVLASNQNVCSVSVIHILIEDADKVTKVLCDELSLPEEEVKKKVNKKSIREKIAVNVDKEIGDKIKQYNVAGIIIDEDYKRYYPHEDLLSKVIGFTGADNQGVVGLEVSYNDVLMGQNGFVKTTTDVVGRPIANIRETRVEPVAGDDLYLTIDYNIQMYAQQLCETVRKEKDAKQVAMIVMNPQNGEIYAMVNVPEYNLNQPFTIIDDENDGDVVNEDERNDNDKKEKQTSKRQIEDKQDKLNRMWRNFCIHDTYEPGSVYKMVTATAALEEKKVTKEDRFYCPGYRIVEDRRIRCHKTTGHGSESFKEGIMNSCNPVFIEVGARVGAKKMYHYYDQLGLREKTGVDLNGEANSIMHKIEDVKSVELATMSFGQSIQVTPMQMIVAASAIINGGDLVTPHFAMKSVNKESDDTHTFSYSKKENVISDETSETMRELLLSVVAEGGGNKAYIEGYEIGGKTATSEKLPRGNGKYISSFVGFAPADDPKIIAMVLIDEPKGVYYGGTIAAPVVRKLYENILPYMGLKPDVEEDIKDNNEEIDS